MKLSLVSIAVVLAYASAFTTDKPAFSRSVVRVGATPSAEDLEKTRKVIQDFMDMKDGVAPAPAATESTEEKPKKKKGKKKAAAAEE